MAFIDLESMSPHQIISRYILEVRQKGLSLAPGDYQIIDGWLHEAGMDVDALLYVLSEVLPDYYKKASQPCFRTLRPLAQRVVTKIKELKSSG